MVPDQGRGLSFPVLCLTNVYTDERGSGLVCWTARPNQGIEMGGMTVQTGPCWRHDGGACMQGTPPVPIDVIDRSRGPE